jgi:sulfatase modifying factor 1
MRDKTASPAVVFEKVLRAFETGGFTYADVIAQLKRLLTSGASPAELLEVLRREELNEPLPEHVHVKVLDVLNDALGRAAAQANVSEVEGPTKATPVALTSVFEKVLNAIETRDFSDADVLAELQRLLLVTGASPAALLEILRRRKLIEPLSENAYAEVLGVLNEAMGGAGAPAESDEALKPEPSAATGQIPDSVPAALRFTPLAPPVEQTKRAAKASAAVTPLRHPDLSPTGTPNRTTTTVSVPPTPIQIAPTQAARPVSFRIPTTSPAKAPGPTPTVTPGPIPVIGPSRRPTEGVRAAVTPTRSPPPSSAPPKSGTPTPIPPQPTGLTLPLEPMSTRSPAVEHTVAVTSARTLSPDPAKTEATTQVAPEPTSSIPAATPDTVSVQMRTALPALAQTTTPKTETPPPVSAQTIAPSSFPESMSTQSAPMEPNTAVPPTRTPAPDTVAANTETVPPVAAQTSAPDSSAVSKPGPPTIPAPPPWAVEAAVADEEVTIDLDEFDHVFEQAIVIEEALSRDSVEVGDVLLDRYRLVALIGEGGMSRVFKATDLGKTDSVSPDSFIAVKVLRSPIGEDNGSFASFRKEVQKLRGLTHPNIVRVFDCDRDRSIVFITMEYLAGPSLYAKLHDGAAAGKPPPGLGHDEAQHIILAVADALDYAHRNGVVHGDLKPGNVIVLNRGEIKVIDFDMARWVARPEAGVERRESPQQRSPPGVTPGYASPQLMARQKPEPADDVYALACLAYELLTGTHPFDAGEGAQSLKFPPPHRAELSAPQYSALVRGLRPDRNDRTPTVRQFVAEFSAPERQTGWKLGAIGRAIRTGAIGRAIKSRMIARAIRPGAIRRAIKPRMIARAAGVAAAALAFAVVAWFSIHRAPVPVPVPVASSPAVPNPGTVIRDCPTCPAMTVLPAGRFKQGSAAAENGFAFAKPQHWAVIGRSFAMSTNAVTVDEFHEFITASGRDMQGCETYDGEWKHRPKNNWKNPGFTQAGTHPVTCASWNDAEAYARWLSTETKHRYRLPSASEWEYAARAGGEAVQPWSADGSSACANANLADESAAHRYPGWTVFGCDDGHVYTAPVGSFKANSFGLNDMLGNVLQWTEDCWRPDYNGAPIDGSARTDGNCSERELRGGSWFTTPAYVRADYRNHFAIDYRTSSVGIRLVRDIEQ